MKILKLARFSLLLACALTGAMAQQTQSGVLTLVVADSTGAEFCSQFSGTSITVDFTRTGNSGQVAILNENLSFRGRITDLEEEFKKQLALIKKLSRTHPIPPRFRNPEPPPPLLVLGKVSRHGRAKYEVLSMSISKADLRTVEFSYASGKGHKSICRRTFRGLLNP